MVDNEPNPEMQGESELRRERSALYEALNWQQTRITELELRNQSLTDLTAHLKEDRKNQSLAFRKLQNYLESVLCSDEFFRAFYRSMDVNKIPAVIVDSNDRLRSVNRSFLYQFDVDEEEAVGRKYTDFILGDSTFKKGIYDSKVFQIEPEEVTSGTKKGRCTIMKVAILEPKTHVHLHTYGFVFALEWYPAKLVSGHQETEVQEDSKTAADKEQKSSS